MKTKIVQDIEDFTESVEEDSTVCYFLKREGKGTISSYIEDSGYMLNSDSIDYLDTKDFEYDGSVKFSLGVRFGIN